MRRFRHRATGEIAVLSIWRCWPTGQERYLVQVAREGDRTVVPGVMYATGPGTRKPVREV